MLVILARTTRPLTGRAVARLVDNGSQAGVNRVLRRLVEHGLVLATEAGASFLYVLNRAHLAAPLVANLAGLRDELVRRLRASVGAWELPPLHASLFGSTARGDGDTRSDIDILLVRPARVAGEARIWRTQVESWVKDIRGWTGNDVGLAEISEKELAQLRRRRPAIVAALRSEAITFAGHDAARILRRAG